MLKELQVTSYAVKLRSIGGTVDCRKSSYTARGVAWTEIKKKMQLGG